jgi:drug/metabolite transporter (DMT)-like permease
MREESVRSSQFVRDGSAIMRKHPVAASTAVLATLCALLWGGQSVAVKYSQEGFEVFQVTTLRFLLSAVLTACLAWMWRLPLGVSGRQFRLAAVNALFVFMQISLYTAGTFHTSSIHSIVIISTFPFFTALWCHYLLPGFPLTLRIFLGLLLAFAGVVFVSLDLRSAQEATLEGAKEATLQGDLLVLLAAVVMGAKITYMKTTLARLRPLQLVFWESIVVLPLFAVVSLVGEKAPDTVSWQAAGGVVYQGVLVSGVAFLIWNYLLSQHSPNEVTVFRLATPLVGVLAGWLLLGEQVSWHLLAGGALIVVGIWRVT